MVEANYDGDGPVWEHVRADNQHFKSLLDLVPPQAYFTLEQKAEIWGNESEDEDDNYRSGKKKKRKRKGHGQSLSSYSVTQITEMRQKGETLGGAKKQKVETKSNDSTNTDAAVDPMEEKHQGKKQSRSAKGKKNKGKELEKREARLEELKEKLRKKLEDMKAMKNAGNAPQTQEEKRLRRKQSKLNAKLKKSGTGTANSANKEAKALEVSAATSLRSPPQKQILNQNGQPVKSKFDFSVISFNDDVGGGRKSKEERGVKSDLHGRDYKRLLEKVEKRQEKVEELKETNPEKAAKLEEKYKWQAMINKARGEKVKDNPELLKKAAKRKDKIKEKKGQKWEARKASVQETQKKKTDKRQANLDKRRDASKEKKRKKMIKKGRIIPGF